MGNHIAGKFKSLKFDNDDEGRPTPTLKCRLTGATESVNQLIEDWYSDGAEVEVTFREAGVGDPRPADDYDKATLTGEITSLKFKNDDENLPVPVFKLDLNPDVFESKQLLDIWEKTEADFVMIVEKLQMELDVEMNTSADVEESEAPDEEEAPAPA